MEIKLKCSDYTKKINFKEAVKNVFDFNIGTAATEIVGISHSKEMKAFQLLFNTFKSTNTQLKKELGQEILNTTTGLSVISAEFEIAFKKYLEQEITLTKDFFEDILKHNPDYLKESYKIFKLNLEELQIHLPENFEYNYYITYRDNLYNEFQENSDYYQELVTFFNNPVFEQNKPFNTQLSHYQNIKKFFTTPLQPDIEECIESLKDLYIDPYFSIYKNNTDFRSENSYEYFQSPKSQISIHNFLNNYFLKGIKHNDLKTNYNMLFLLGQPGQGKTSFCYKLIYDYLETNNGLPEIPIYFIKIRDLIAKDFINDTFSTITKYLNQNISFETDNCVLLLDGLDEAYMAGGLNDNDLKNLYDRLNKTAQQNKNLKIILTSRLNYLKINDPCLDKSLVCQLDVLTDDQIREYTIKHKKFYPQNKFLNNIETILTEYEYLHIKELLQQAVLIYFIAMADINIEEKDSKANIYDKIFDSLAKRSWDKQRGQLDYIKPAVKDNYNLYAKHLRIYIKNIAFEIYQSPNLYITLDKLSDLQSTKTFIKKCFNEDIFNSKNEIKELNKYLLISFYFQESSNNKSTDTAIEFFHNSLWEYLTAEYMWEANKNILLRKDDDGEYENVSKEAYFQMLNNLVDQKEFGGAVNENLSYIIENENIETKRTIFNQSIKIFYKLSEDDFLLDYSKRENQLSVIEKAGSIFGIFWNFLFYSNYNLDNKIVTNNNINRLLFVFSKYRLRYIKNIIFQEDLSGFSYLLHSSIENTHFNQLYDLKYAIETEINNSVFYDCRFGKCSFVDNTFINVTFDNCYFYKSDYISDNKFINVKFNNVEVNSLSWLLQLEKKNEVDQTTKDNNIIEKIIEKDYEGRNVTKYYIRYLGQ